MPPIRTPARAVKTERTHAENQERAYIAASRRSDRSLEARVESARRASEIHKERTGRSLRVTEADVANEEMYEEEEDDIPSQYRRLSSHIQVSGAAMFNDRLSAYLTSNVAIRAALERSIQDSYKMQPTGGSPQVYNNQALSSYPQHPSQMNSQPHSALFRSTPYPQRPQQQPFQYNQQLLPQGQHQRSASIATPQDSMISPISPPLQPNDLRRMSMPVNNVATAAKSPAQTQTPASSTSGASSPQLQRRPELPVRAPSFPPGSFSGLRPDLPVKQEANQSWDTNFNIPSQTAQQNLPELNKTSDVNASILSSALPANIQGLLGNTMDPNNPYTSQMMRGSETRPGAFFYFDAQTTLPATTSIGKHQTHPSLNGLSSTLSPSALETLQSDQNFTPNFFNDALISDTADMTPSGLGNEPFNWDDFVDDGNY